jgi:hypothetical protein
MVGLVQEVITQVVAVEQVAQVVTVSQEVHW